MHFLQSSGFNWKELLVGGEDWNFLFEVVLRTIIMFIVIVTSLRILGKRGVKQLSVFELVVIIGLGSAAGDPMFYKDVGIIPALIVFSLIVILYKLVMFLIGKSTVFENLVEGSSVCLIAEGKFAISNFKKETLSQYEFFAELRLKGVMHLGQVHLSIIETTGDISVFFYPDEDVKWGLPILPDLFQNKTVKIPKAAHYSCTFCGYTEKLKPATQHTCPLCKRKKWVEAINNIRVR